jgi:hypothetical protein
LHTIGIISSSISKIPIFDVSKSQLIILLLLQKFQYSILYVSKAQITHKILILQFFNSIELSQKSPCLHPVFGSPFTPYPLFQWYPQSKEILLNLSMKCWNSTADAQGLRVIIVVVQAGAVKIYVGYPALWPNTVLISSSSLHFEWLKTLWER